MVHLDVNKVGRVPDGGGWRAHGRGSTAAKAVTWAKKAGVRAGYVHSHSAIDGFSRLACIEALPDEKAATTIGFLRRARAFFAAHGITHIERIVTDNGACYRAHNLATVLHGHDTSESRPTPHNTTTKPNTTTTTGPPHHRWKPATSLTPPHRPTSRPHTPRLDGRINCTLRATHC